MNVVCHFNPRPWGYVGLDSDGRLEYGTPPCAPGAYLFEVLQRVEVEPPGGQAVERDCLRWYYVGETSNLADRLSGYATAARAARVLWYAALFETPLARLRRLLPRPLIPSATTARVGANLYHLLRDETCTARLSLATDARLTDASARTRPAVLEQKSHRLLVESAWRIAMEEEWPRDIESGCELLEVGNSDDR